MTGEPTPRPGGSAERGKTGRPSRTRRAARSVNAVFLVIGLVLLVGLVLKLDASEVLARLAQAGWTLIPAFAAYLLNVCCSAMAWREMMPSRPRFLLVLGTFWAGTAMNQVSPVGPAGELLKGSILSREVRGEEVVASLVVNNFLNLTILLSFTVLGPGLCLLFLPLPAEVIGSVFAVAAVMLGVVLLFGLLLRKGLARRAVRLAGRLPVLRRKNLARLEERAEEVDHRVRSFRRERPAAFARAVLFVALVRVFLIIEAWFLLLGLFPDAGMGWLLLLAMLTQSTSQIINWTMIFVPGRVGVIEGGVALLFEGLGLTAVTGLSFALLRRVRKTVGIAMGLVIGSVVEMRTRRLRESQPDVPAAPGAEAPDRAADPEPGSAS